jgi:hypothetical protein
MLLSGTLAALVLPVSVWLFDPGGFRRARRRREAKSGRSLACCYLTRERAEKVSVYRDYYGTPGCGTDVIAIEWNDGGTRARRWRRSLQTSRDSYPTN